MALERKRLETLHSLAFAARTLQQPLGLRDGHLHARQRGGFVFRLLLANEELRPAQVVSTQQGAMEDAVVPPPSYFRNTTPWPTDCKTLASRAG